MRRLIQICCIVTITTGVAADDKWDSCHWGWLNEMSKKGLCDERTCDDWDGMWKRCGRPKVTESVCKSIFIDVYGQCYIKDSLGSMAAVLIVCRWYSCRC